MVPRQHRGIASAIARAALTASALGYCGCGPSIGATSSDDGVELPPGPVEVSPLCGSDGPARILPLALNEFVWPRIPFGDRLLVGVSQYDSIVSYDRLPSMGLRTGRQILSIDECGNDSKVVATDLDHIYAPDHDGQPWLAHAHNERLMWFDPNGQHPPRFVDAAGSSPKHQRVGDQILLESAAGLVRIRFEDDGTQHVVELGEVWPDWIATARPGDPPTLVVLSLYEHDFVEINALTGDRNTLRAGVSGFDASSDGRFVVWWPRSNDPESPPPAEPNPRLWDRQRDVEVVLAPGMDLYTVHIGVGGVAAISSDRQRTEITFLDDLAQATVDDAFTVRAAGADGSLLLSSGAGPNYGSLYTFVHGDSQPILRGREGVKNRYVWAGEDAYWSVEQVDGSAPGNPPGPYPGTHANVVRFAYDDPVSETVVSEIWEPVMLGDGHWAGARNYADDPVGELWLQTSTGEEILVDRDVYADVNGLNQQPYYDGPPRRPAQLDRDWLYLVVDVTGERNGLWRAAIELVQ